MLPTLSLLLLGGRAHALELFVLEGQAISPVTYRAPEAVTAQVNDIATHLTVPIPLGTNVGLLPRVGYRREVPRMLDPPDSVPVIPDLHAVEVALSVYQTERGPWSLLGQVSGGLAGDFASIDRDVVRLGAAALATRELSDQLVLGAGLSASYVFGELLPIPLLKVDWAPSEAIHFEALLPADATFTYTRRDRLRVGALAEIVGNEYALRNADVRDRYCPAGGDPAQCIDHLAYTDGNVGALLGVRLSGGLWLEGHAGASVYRRFELLNEQGEPVDIGDQRLSPASYVRLRLRYVHG